MDMGLPEQTIVTNWNGNSIVLDINRKVNHMAY